MKPITQFAVQNYVITPASLAVNQQPPQNISAQKWEIVLSGVAIADLKCTSANDWTTEKLHLIPDYKTAIQYAINQFGIPVPSDPPYLINTFDPPEIARLFQVEQYTFHASLGSVYNTNIAVNAGFAVNNWRPVPLGQLDPRPGYTAPVVKRIFNGFEVDVAIRDLGAFLYRVNFQATLLGKIVFAKAQGM